MTRYNLGWRRESERHSLAAKRVRTGRKSKADKLFDDIIKLPEKFQESIQPSKRRKKMKMSAGHAAAVVGVDMISPLTIPDEEECEEILDV